MSTGIVLIAHGSRRAEANAELVAVADSLRRRVGDRFVEVAYLELAEPTIPEALQRCLDRGAREIRMLPYFLSPGAHVTDDLESFRSRFRAAHPGIECRLCPPIGLHPKIVDVLLDRLEEG